MFARPVAAPTVFADSVVLTRLMLGLPDSALFSGITVPAGAGLSTPSAVRAGVNARCGTSF